MPADPTQWGLPADAVEVVAQRTEGAKVFQTGSRQYTAILSPDIHYQDETGDWQEVDTTWGDATDTGYTDAVDKAKYRVRMGSDGKRRIYPRRNVLTEYVEFAPLQAWSNNQWRNIPWTSKTRSGNTITLDRSNASLTATLSGNRFKIDITLKDSSAATPLRWPVSLTGLTRNGWSLASDSDGSTVMEIDPLYLTDAVGVTRDVTASIVNGAVQFTADASGLTYPIVVDPTTTFSTGVSGDAGYVTASGSSYPPAATSTDTTQINVTKSKIGTPYTVETGMLRFDTSSLPDTATVTSTTLRLTQFSTHTTANARTLEIEYYASSNWPINTADYTASVSGNAATGVALSNWGGSSGSDGTQYTITLSNVNNISLTGYTGFRMALSGAAPTGQNIIQFYPLTDGSAANRPLLSVTYSTIVNYNQTLTASVSKSAAMVRGLGLTRSKSVALTPSLRRGVSKVLSKSLSVTPSVVKNLPKTFSAAVGVAASLTYGFGYTLEKMASVSVSAAKTLGVGINRAASLSVTPAMRRGVDLTISKAVTISPSALFGKGVELLATVSVSGSMTKGVSLIRDALVSLTGSEVHGFSVTKVLTATVSIVSSLSFTRGMAATRQKIRGGWIWVVEETKGFVYRKNR